MQKEDPAFTSSKLQHEPFGICTGYESHFLCLLMLHNTYRPMCDINVMHQYECEDQCIDNESKHTATGLLSSAGETGNTNNNIL